ncbi:hypothetical protein K3495_g5766 [Podosphaera aphanis]|nr:hypothetical protein K3495_g5766 [Podosphaera aphanis]
MTVKSVNDTSGSNGLVPTFLVFGAYPKISSSSPLSPTISARSVAIRKAMKEVKHIHAKRQVKDARRMRNGPNVGKILQLSLNENVLVWREKDSWTGPFKILAIDGDTCTVDLPHGLTNFRSTVVKPYYTDDYAEIPTDKNSHSDSEPIDLDEDEWTPHNEVADTPKRGRGRPEGSRNKTGLPTIYLNTSNTHPKSMVYHAATLSAKEQYELNLSLQLRKEGKILTPGNPFEASDKAEIDALIANNVFQFEKFDSTKH